MRLLEGHLINSEYCTNKYKTLMKNANNIDDILIGGIKNCLFCSYKKNRIIHHLKSNNKCLRSYQNKYSTNIQTDVITFITE